MTVDRKTIIALCFPLAVAAIALVIVIICLLTRQPAPFVPMQLGTV